jgi:hypothetical protein
LEGSWFKASLGEKLVRLFLTNNLGGVVHTCNPGYWEAWVGGSPPEAVPTQAKTKDAICPGPEFKLSNPPPI